MLQPNINAKQIKEVFYNASNQSASSTINITVENCHVNAFIEQIVINFVSTDVTCGNITASILDRGNGYPNSINGFNPVTFANIGYTTSPVTLQNLVPNSANTQVTIFIYESVQDSEGLGNIYVKLAKSSGTFNVSFTMTVIYRPEVTYEAKLNTRNQISNDKYPRVLWCSQGPIGYATTSQMVEASNLVAKNYNARNNIDTATFGFPIYSTSPVFYFGTPWPTKRWFIGFNQDNTPNLGIVTFSYWNGVAFTGFTTAYIGALGPGTYQFAYDGVCIFTPQTTQVAYQMPNDPYVVYNTTQVGLGTLGNKNLLGDTTICWIQCNVGFATTGVLTISTIVPLIDPALPLTYRRRLI
jgi:hypothetical protein